MKGLGSAMNVLYHRALMAATYLAILLLFARSHRTEHTGLSVCTDRELHSHGRDCNISLLILD
mgnify:CR=1 FL=1